MTGPRKHCAICRVWLSLDEEYRPAFIEATVMSPLKAQDVRALFAQFDFDTVPSVTGIREARTGRYLCCQANWIPATPDFSGDRL